MRVLQPAGWMRPKGYSNAIEAKGRMIFLAGQVGWDENQRFLSHDLLGQFDQVLKNTIALLKEGGAGPEHVVRMTWYITDLHAYRAAGPELGTTYRKYMGKNFPVMAVVGVDGLVEPEALIEIETTAVVPE